MVDAAVLNLGEGQVRRAAGPTARRHVELIRGDHEAVAPRNAYYRAKGLFHVVSALGDMEDVVARMSVIVQDA